MDSKKHTDWTEAVRDRLESRELTPPDALWERIEAAEPQAGAAHKVRRLAWGGALGVAAAAAIAAVVFLRPAGTRTPGDVDIVRNVTAPVAEATVTEPTQPAAELAEPEAGQVLPMARPARPVTATAVPVRQTPDQEPARTIPVEAQSEPVQTVDVVPNAVPAQREKSDAASVKQTTTASTARPATAGVPQMTMDEYIAQENAAQRRHRGFAAAVYASGMPSANISALARDLAAPAASRDLLSYNDPVSLEGVSPDVAYTSDSGYTTNPESQLGYDPIKYKEDHYNINGARLNHSRPINAGLALTLPLSDHLFVESGLYWSYLHSSSYLMDQTLHSAGIPLKMGYRLGGAGRTSFSFSAGAKAEKVVYAVRAGDRVKEPGLQLAAVGSAAVQYDIAPRLGVFLAPELSYWFTETKLPTYNTENPFNLSLKAGLNVTLGR